MRGDVQAGNAQGTSQEFGNESSVFTQQIRWRTRPLLGIWRPIRVDPLASGTRPRLRQSLFLRPDCANLLRCRPAHGPPRHSSPWPTIVASEIGPVRPHAYDWANLRTGRVGTWQPIRVGPLASETRPRLAQS